MQIKVCVGSSCHLKGSYDVIEAFKEILKRHDVEDLVELQASFCLGNCANGVTLQVDGVEEPHIEKIGDDKFRLHNVTKDNAESVFTEQIRPLLNI